MVRKDELHEQSELVQQLSAFVKKRVQELGFTTQDVADRIKHAKSYAYNRLNGDAQFTLDDLVELSPFLGYKDIFAFWRAFDTDQRYQAAKKRDTKPTKQLAEQQLAPWMLVANEDENKQAEREEYYD